MWQERKGENPLDLPALEKFPSYATVYEYKYNYLQIIRMLGHNTYRSYNAAKTTNKLTTCHKQWPLSSVHKKQHNNKTNAKLWLEVKKSTCQKILIKTVTWNCLNINWCYRPLACTVYATLFGSNYILSQDKKVGNQGSCTDPRSAQWAYALKP